MNPRPDTALATSDRAGDTQLSVVSLFSGVGGLDLGLERAGHRIVEMCESWAPARAVLTRHFPAISVADDVRSYTPQQPYDLLTAGFPCVDLSHAGGQRGLFGPHSGLVEHVFRIAQETKPEWILLENVPNLLRLQRGAGIAHIVDELTQLGYAWAYRVVDSRFTGVPQRRNRVLILASLNHDPADVLLADDVGEPAVSDDTVSGFYWTEGRRGVGLVRGAIPTLKGGSTVGAPSDPAIWNTSATLGARIALATIEDGEELQGFPRGWTDAAESLPGPKQRWKLVGNAVTVGVAEWIGGRLREPSRYSHDAETKMTPGARWPDAAWGSGDEVWISPVSKYPARNPPVPLSAVVDVRTSRPLSYRATAGFLSRVEESGIKLDEAFLTDLETHLAQMRAPLPARAESWASSSTVRQRMQRVKSRDTKPEQQLRKALTELGLRYRLQTRPEADLRWRSDIVFRGRRVVVDIRGCFWHACDLHGTLSKVNTDRWAQKLAATRERDERMVSELSARGWQVIVIWEHEDPTDAAARVRDAVTAAAKPKATSG